MPAADTIYPHLLGEAAKALIHYGCASTDQVRTKLRVDGPTAAALVAELKRLGIVSGRSVNYTAGTRDQTIAWALRTIRDQYPTT